MEQNNENKNPAHEDLCPVKGVGRWAIAGQAMFSHPSGKQHFFMTTLFCQECGFIKIVVTPVQLPEMPTIAVAKPMIVTQKH